MASRLEEWAWLVGLSSSRHSARARVLAAVRGELDLEKLPPGEREALLAAAAHEGVRDFLLSKCSAGWARPAGAVAASVLVADATRRVVDELEAAGLACAVLKGVAVAHLAWKDPSLRPQSDVDLLLRRDDLAVARAVLLRSGLATGTWLEGSYSHHMVLTTGYPGVVRLELHHELAMAVPVCVRTPDLLARTIRITTPDGHLPALSHEDAVVHLALQAAIHTFDRLSWLVDLAGYAERQKVDWASAAERAYAWQVAIPVEIAWGMAVRLLDAPIPPETLGRLGTSWARLAFCHALLACRHRAHGPARRALGRAFRLSLLPSVCAAASTIRRTLLARAEARRETTRLR